jgi:hypothetical protein
VNITFTAPLLLTSMSIDQKPHFVKRFSNIFTLSQIRKDFDDFFVIFYSKRQIVLSFQSVKKVLLQIICPKGSLGERAADVVAAGKPPNKATIYLFNQQIILYVELNRVLQQTETTDCFDIYYTTEKRPSTLRYLYNHPCRFRCALNPHSAQARPSRPFF